MNRQDYLKILEESMKRLADLAKDSTQLASIRLNAETQIVNTLRFIKEF